MLMNIELTEEQTQQIMKQQADRIDELECRIARVKGKIRYWIRERGDLKTKVENLSEIERVLMGME